jgi:hypothetical protein
VHAGGSRITLNAHPQAQPNQATLMNKPAHTHRWFSGWRSAPRPAEEDPADYGTAFGLDLSLHDVRTDPAAPVVAKAQTGWVQRLAARRRPAT